MKARSALVPLTLLLLCGIGFPVAQVEGKPPEKQKTAVIHLSHYTDDLHRAFMAMKIARMMQNGGVETTLFLDIEGARISDARQSLDMCWGPSPTPLGAVFDDFIKSGGKVVVCPHCAKAAGIKSDHLRQGTTIGTEEELARLLISTDKIMDY
ncbi:DsrE family protein [Gimesia algae]|uniref:Uncharacterized protein n=1 Tax=Gimesia algae TaxID=2527971 RepID=A0A517VHJ2_9PLAN|nr:DsrE family protein [Gimesia algae]QDT92480.1 hypothetical protein Pan161_41470 [Gimesia algae]